MHHFYDDVIFLVVMFVSFCRYVGVFFCMPLAFFPCVLEPMNLDTSLLNPTGPKILRQVCDAETLWCYFGYCQMPPPRKQQDVLV